ncbi:uncharacterized protein [Drosophila takahashii]|uniref:uncharacterized protein n=1 Tax=Drosophila takahashii TaxID=29030 RepID=UPI001CF8C2CD|nr:uncharacterized protein LOC108055290 [Drosophila takahashii]
MDQYSFKQLTAKEKAKQQELENRGKLDVMRYLRECSGRKYDKPVTLADWDDESNLEQEIVDQMRHIGFKSWDEDADPMEPLNLPGLPASKNPLVLGTGNNQFPLIVDPNYFNRYKTPRITIRKDLLPGYESFERE